MMFGLGLIAGCVMGACVSVIVFALCMASGKDRRDDEY